MQIRCRFNVHFSWLCVIVYMNSLFSNLYLDYNDMIYNISIMIFSKIKKVKLCVRGYEHIAMPKAKTKNIKYPKG